MTNEERTAQGNKVLAFYETLYGVDTRADGASFEQVLTDLLADLRHAAAAHDVECFEDAAAKSLMHFECETETEVEVDA